MFNHRYFPHGYFNPRYFDQQQRFVVDAGTVTWQIAPSGEGQIVTGQALIAGGTAGKRRRYADRYAPIPIWESGTATFTLVASGEGRIVGISRADKRRAQLRQEEETLLLLLDDWREAA